MAVVPQLRSRRIRNHRTRQVDAAAAQVFQVIAPRGCIRSLLDSGPCHHRNTSNLLRPLGCQMRWLCGGCAWHMERRNQNLPAGIHADKVIRLAPLANETAVVAQHHPVQRRQGTAPADWADLKLLKSPASVAVLLIVVGHTLEETGKLLTGLKGVNRTVAAHRDSRYVEQCSDPLTVYRVEGILIPYKERANVRHQFRVCHWAGIRRRERLWSSGRRHGPISPIPRP